MSSDDIHYLDPFNQTADLSIEVIEEEYTIRRYSRLGANWYGIQLKSPPAYKNLTSESKRIIAIKSDDPGYEYTEVSFTSAPSTSQYRVDYDNRNPSDGSVLGDYTTTGLVQFNATEEGQLVKISYWSTGLGVFSTNLAAFLADEVIPGDLGVSGKLGIAGLGSSVWGSDFLVFETGLGARAYQVSTNYLFIATNAYHDGSVWRSIATGDGGIYTHRSNGTIVYTTFTATGADEDLTSQIASADTISMDSKLDANIASNGTSIYGRDISGTILFLKKINIGDWNMDTTSEVSIAHGLTYSKIQNVWAIIRNDGDTNRQMLIQSTPLATGTPASQIGFLSTNIILARETSGNFDNASYNATSYNRGFAYIVYEK